MIKFTKEEKTAIIFLLICLFAGVSALHYRQAVSQPGDIVYLKEKKNEKVNINLAGRERLRKLRRIGPALAGRIIAFRKMHGPFRSKDDLKLVKGIGEKIYEGLKDSITLE